MSDFSTLTVSVDDTGLGRLTLDQPEALNPLGVDCLAEIAEAARWLDANGAIVVIVTGAGDRAFSAGFDLRQFNDPPPGKGGAELGGEMATAVEAMNAVTIAAIHGHCIGGGLVLAAACDMRIAADNTNFAIPEVDLGIPLAWGGIPRLVREIGPAMTRELVMTCRPFDAHEAKSLAFVNRVVPRAELDAATEEVARSLLTKAPSVLRVTKRQVVTAAENVASTADAWLGAPLLDNAQRDPVARERAAAYLADRGR